jgi:hypothetical protein
MTGNQSYLELKLGLFLNQDKNNLNEKLDFIGNYFFENS